MWVIAGVLLGLVLLFALAGFHLGPHSHALAVIAGVLAGAWLVIMAIDDRGSALLWTLFGADLVVSAGLAVGAWKALGVEHAASRTAKLTRLEGSHGIASTDCRPDGIVRVRGENWTATSANGDLPAGTVVQVLSVDGVRLVVWGEEQSLAPLDPGDEGDPLGRRAG